MDFGTHKDLVDEYLSQLSSKVRRHKLDEDSIEAWIARYTVMIRSLQKLFVEITPEATMYNKTPGLVMKATGRMRTVRRIIGRMVNSRRLMLKRLRNTDFKRYEWVLEQLDLVFKEKPIFEEDVEREKHLMRLTDL